MSGTTTISGVISGLDTSNILDQLRQAAQVPVLRLQAQKQTASAKIAAWQSLNTSLLSLKETVSALALYRTFSEKLASSSNEALVSATASSSAAAGDYSFIVNSLAAAHRVVSQGYAAETDQVGEGTLSIGVGTASPVVIQVEAGTTLAGLRDEINRAGAGVTAFLLDTGSGDTPYQLVITSGTSGTVGQLDLQLSLSGGTAPTFTDLQAAADASLSLGGGLTITRSTNHIANLFPGLTLDLRGFDPSHAVTVTVTQDTARLQELVQELVTRYNDALDYIQQQWNYDAETDKTGTLFGEYTLFQIQSSLATRISNPVAGLSGLTVLSQVGIRLGTDGRLTLDESDLEAALADSPEAVAQLFSRYGAPSHSDVDFVSATSDTQPSGLAGYAVEITQAATQARLTAGVAQTAALAQDETLTLRGVTINLTAGMTQEQVIAAINSRSAQTGLLASATDSSGQGTGQYLTLTAVAYGSSLDIAAISSQSNAGAASSGLGNLLATESSPEGESGTGTGADGLDVQGTIDGEAADGSGQILKAVTGEAKGLWLNVKATAAGSYGTVTLTRGVAAYLDDQLSFLTDSTTGSIQLMENSLQDQIQNLTDDITRLNDSIDRDQERLKTQFTALEKALGTLQTQSSFLTSQLAQIQAGWG
jgi:flagellar hook-associated protein 2